METRIDRAIELYGHADEWLRAVDRDGEVRFYLVPSASVPGEYWRVTGESCSCPDATYRGVTCKHTWAARLYAAAEAEREAARAKVVELRRRKAVA